MADLVAARHPRQLLNLLAYAHTINCPPDAERLRDNVLVGLYDHFLRERFGKGWGTRRQQISRWIAERSQAAVPVGA